MPIDHTEELFQLILSGLKEIYEVDAVVAGGAVRDLAANAVPKDVDVFLPLSWKDFLGGFPELGWRNMPALVGKGPYSKTKSVHTGPLPFETTARAQGHVREAVVDLVFVKEPLSVEHVATFPIHAQRGVYTLEHGTQMSPEMTKDILNKTFTISPAITDKEKLRAAHDKANSWLKREGYKGWKIVKPDIKEWWEVEEEAKAEKNKAQTVYDSQWSTMFTTWKNLND